MSKGEGIGVVSLGVAFLALIIALGGIVYPETETPDSYLWANEWGWHRSIHIPYSKDGWVNRGVVLDLGASGEWDDYTVCQPCVLRVNGTYLMYYTGLGAVPWTTNARIGLATSTNGLNFTKYGKIIDPESGYTSVLSPAVIYDVYETNSSKQYKMTANAWKTSISAYVSLYYYSNDGTTWTFDRELTGLGRPPILSRIGNAYFVYYLNRSSGNNNIYLSVTRDFSTWHNEGAVITKGASGEWDDKGYGWNSLFWNTGVWYMFLQGKGTVIPKSIGMATSSDGFTWSKYPMNPIQNASTTPWTANGIFQPTVLMVGNMFWLYCSGTDSGNVRRIGRFDIESS